MRRLTGRFFSSKSIVKRLNSARISSALSKIAVQVDEEVTAEIQNFVSVIEPTMVIILSILVGALLLSDNDAAYGNSFCDWIMKCQNI